MCHCLCCVKSLGSGQPSAEISLLCVHVEQPVQKKGRTELALKSAEIAVLSTFFYGRTLIGYYTADVSDEVSTGTAFPFAENEQLCASTLDSCLEIIWRGLRTMSATGHVAKNGMHGG